MKWESGRQSDSYFKMKIFSFWRIDCYILKFPPLSRVPTHTDRIGADKKHFRFNFVFWRAKDGGQIYVKNGKWQRMPRAFIFRPDILPHKMSQVIEGTQYIFTIGIAI